MSNSLPHEIEKKIYNGCFERVVYRCKGHSDLLLLAKAFSEVVKIKNRPLDNGFNIFNWGLEGVPRVGKTTFSTEVIRRDAGFRRDLSGDFDQFMGCSPQFGKVRRVDVAAPSSFVFIGVDISTILAEGWESSLIGLSPQGVSIMEHSNKTHKCKFHVVTNIEKEFPSEDRLYEFFVSEAVSKAPSFQRFKVESAPLLVANVT